VAALDLIDDLLIADDAIKAEQYERAIEVNKNLE
jgi:hypothetical protein